MRIRKLLLVIIVSIMFIPFVVNAETCENDKVSIETIVIKSISENVVENNEPVINGMGVKLDIEMSEVDDSIKYEMTIKNDSNADYKLDKNSLNIETDYVDYTFETKDKTNIVKAKSSSEAVLTVQYKTAVPDELLENGSFTDNQIINIGMNDGKNDIISVLTNPKTGKSYYIFILVILLILSSIAYMIRRKINYTRFLIIIIGLIIIPIGVDARCNLELTVDISLNINSHSDDYPLASIYFEELYNEGNNDDGLIKTNETELRYSGDNSTVKNYVNFNCDNNGENCELWRIIGIFDGRVKLVRDESIGNYSWDSSVKDINGGNGVNEWSQAELMRELNTDYLDYSLSENTLWYNQSYYHATGTFNYTNVLKKDTQSLFADALWYTGGTNVINCSSSYTSGISLTSEYNNERGNQTCQSNCASKDNIPRNTTWTGKIGLIYPSDFGYASSDTGCKSNLSNKGSCGASFPIGNTCINDNWLHKDFSYWTITSLSSIQYGSVCSMAVQLRNGLTVNSVSVALPIFPALYLKDNVHVKGNGTFDVPYEFAK